VPESVGRVRCYHPASGSVIVGEVTDTNPFGDMKVIPEGLLEEVIIRAASWTHIWLNGRGDYVDD